jgi:ribonucleoside-diphosphate reductase alpha chain
MKQKAINYEQAFKESKEYFNDSEMEASVFLDKYALKDNEGNLYEATPDDMHRRIASEVHRIEQKHPNPLTYEEILNSIKDFKYNIPQGSPMAGIGNPYQVMSLSNCLHGDTKVLNSRWF